MTTEATLLPEQLGFSTTWFDLPGLRMLAATAGPADGPLVVMLHGFPEFWYSWRHQIAPLAAAGYRVVVPDQRGYNLTDKTPPYDINTLSADIAHLLDACGAEKAFIVGHDWGGAVSWAFTMRYPERVEKLAICNMPHPATISKALMGFKNLRQLFKSWYIFFVQLPWLPDWLLTVNDHALLVGVLKSSSKQTTFSPEDLEIYRQSYRQRGAVTAMLGWYRAMLRTGAKLKRDGQLGQWRQKVSMPTLIMWGVRDVALSLQLAEDSLKYLEDGQLIRFEKATHWLHEEEYAAVNELMLAHFANPPSQIESG